MMPPHAMSPRDHLRPPSPRGHWPFGHPGDGPMRGPAPPGPSQRLNPSPPPSVGSSGTFTSFANKSAPDKAPSSQQSSSIRRPSSSSTKDASVIDVDVDDDEPIVVGVAPPPPRPATPPPEPKDPSPRLLATTRLIDLEAQMEYAFCKHVQLVLEQQKIRARVHALETFDVGMEALQEDLDALVAAKSSDAAAAATPSASDMVVEQA
jgi:hypothetical protein